jgi:sugar phosphate isomerase/epimerase
MSVPYEETQLMPLITDQDVERRVADLIGRANSRQLWLLFLDESDIQLPLLVPIEGLPSEPTDEQADAVLERVREVMGEIGATAVITVLERYGAPSLTMQDAAWVRALRRGCSRRGVTLRAQLLSHRTGVRWIGPEEASTEEASTEEASTEEASTEEASTEEASTEEASTEDGERD